MGEGGRTSSTLASMMVGGRNSIGCADGGLVSTSPAPGNGKKPSMALRGGMEPVRSGMA